MAMDGKGKWKYQKYIIKKPGNEMGSVRVRDGKREESSTKKERGIWVVVEERRGRRVVCLLVPRRGAR